MMKNKAGRSAPRTTHREDHELPLATGSWGWRYHHMGIPTDRRIAGERYLSGLKCYVSGFPTSPFGIEWMRFDQGSPVHELIQRLPHIAFEVDDLDLELSRHDFEILSPPDSPSGGVRVAMILHNGAPVELIEFSKVKDRQGSRGLNI